jgi:hypothetical protein
VSEILAALLDRGLVDRTGRPSIPDLFNEMADAWAPAWRPLGSLPESDFDLYRLSGTLGALWHQAPVVATADWPAELYVGWTSGGVSVPVRVGGTGATDQKVGDSDPSERTIWG